MQVSKLEIFCFRGIRHGDFLFQELTTLIGANNVGKTGAKTCHMLSTLTTVETPPRQRSLRLPIGDPDGADSHIR